MFSLYKHRILAILFVFTKSWKQRNKTCAFLSLNLSLLYILTIFSVQKCEIGCIYSINHQKFNIFGTVSLMWYRWPIQNWTWIQYLRCWPTWSNILSWNVIKKKFSKQAYQCGLWHTTMTVTMYFNVCFWWQIYPLKKACQLVLTMV